MDRLRQELRARMAARGFSQSDLLDRAAELGGEVSRRQLQRLLSSRESIPPRDMLEPLCRAVDLDWTDAADLL